MNKNVIYGKPVRRVFLNYENFIIRQHEKITELIGEIVSSSGSEPQKAKSLLNKIHETSSNIEEMCLEGLGLKGPINLPWRQLFDNLHTLGSILTNWFDDSIISKNHYSLENYEIEQNALDDNAKDNVGIWFDILEEIEKLRLASKRVASFSLNTDNLEMTFDLWGGRYSNALAWYLASKICDRFYCSHGIVPHVLVHEGMRYYGILLDYTECSVHGKKDSLGRLTAGGNVENWKTGSPGDHGLELVERMERGEPIELMVQEVIQHLRLPAYPSKTHLYCRHKRWGQSYVLMFKIAALLKIRNPSLKIWNHPYMTDRKAKKLDPNANQKEHLGYFLIEKSYKSEIIFSGDGKIIKPVGNHSLWERYMAGKSAIDLVLWIENELSN